MWVFFGRETTGFLGESVNVERELKLGILIVVLTEFHPKLMQMYLHGQVAGLEGGRVLPLGVSRAESLKQKLNEAENETQKIESEFGVIAAQFQRSSET